MKKLVMLLAWVIGLTLLAAPLAFAKYPDKPITYIISFNPGGESDITARLQEKDLEKELGVPVNVTHKVGGGGAVAWSEFQRTARPDGYQIIGINLPHIVGQPLQRKDAGYETDNFAFIIWFHFTPSALLVSNESPYKTLKDFIAYAKKNPKAAVVGGSGTYTANHLETLRIEKVSGIKVTYVPHTGTGPLVPALLGGHVTAIMSYSMLGVQYKDKMRTLAVASDERVATLPDAPTFKELGYDIVGGAYRGVAAPKGTPEAIIKRLADAFLKVNKIVAQKQERLGFVMTYVTGKDAIKLVDEVKKSYGGILKALAKKPKKK